MFWNLLCQFPGKLEVIQQNGYDLWNQHPSISLKRIFWSLQFTKNRKFEICVMNSTNLKLLHAIHTEAFDNLLKLTSLDLDDNSCVHWDSKNEVLEMTLAKEELKKCFEIFSMMRLYNFCSINWLIDDFFSTICKTRLPGEWLKVQLKKLKPRTLVLNWCGLFAGQITTQCWTIKYSSHRWMRCYLLSIWDKNAWSCEWKRRKIPI